jgi:hypothetical protein
MMEIAVQKEIQKKETQTTRPQERKEKGRARTITGARAQALGSTSPLLVITGHVS